VSGEETVTRAADDQGDQESVTGREAALLDEIGDLKATVDAIRTGGIDAVMIPGPEGGSLYTLTSADRPYRVLVEEMGDGAATLSEGGILLFANQRFADLLGVERVSLLGRDLTDLVQAHDPTILGELLATVPGTTVHHELTLIHPDGQSTPVLASATGLDLDGSIVRCLIVTDLTEIMKARQEAQRLSSELKTSNDSLRDFVAVASHDLRSPLVTIAGFTKILADNWATLSDEVRLKQLGAIQRGVDRLSRLTNDLLASAKVEAEAEQAQPEHIRLATALASYLEAGREELGAVAVTCPSELVAVVDPSHLTRILDNYLGNAFKYGEPPICIEAQRVGDFVELRVRDHGPGVPPEFVSRLFTKFGRVNTPATRVTQGTGLGLSIVKALAEANHGDASYQQNEPTGGCFVVRLPAAVA